MSCREMREWIVDDLAGSLSTEDRRTLEEHLESCGECAEEAQQVRRLWEELGEVAVLRDPAEGLERLQARVAEEFGDGAPGRPAVPHERRRWSAWFQRAALAAVLVLGGFFLGQRLAVKPEPPDTAAQAPEGSEDILPRFALLIYEVPGDEELAGRVSEEIGDWARVLFRQGIVEEGKELVGPPAFAGDPGAEVAGRISAAPRITHVLQIRAVSLEAAREVAATAPSTAYGGVVEVRPLDE